MDENITLVLQMTETVSVLVASIVAIIGVTSWRKEAKWRREYELAEEVLTCFYEAQDSIKNIRSPISNVSEGKSRKKSLSETPEESSILDSAFVVYERFNGEKETFVKLRKIKFRYMALFGKSHVKPFDELNLLMVELLTAANLLGTIYWMNQGRRQWKSEQEFQHHLSEMTALQNKIWIASDPDEFGNRVSSIVAEIEAICASKINRKNK